MRRVATIEGQRGNWDAAVSWVRQAVEANPQDLGGRIHLSNVLLRAGHPEEAEQAAREALDLRPDSPAMALRQLSIVAGHRKDIAAALDWARQAAKADPEDAIIQLHLCRQLTVAGDLEDADQVAERALALSPATLSALVLRQRSTIASRRNMMEDAVAWARQAIEADPVDAVSYNHLAGLLLQRGDLDGAEQAALEALRLNTGDVTSIRRQIDRITQRKQAALAAS
nr:tetratricopeptide repeat protein [Roseomonas marmotae]